MASTNFVPRETVITAEWLNQVNAVVFNSIYWWDPKKIYSLTYGVNDVTTSVQACLDEVKNTTFPTAKRYGRGGEVVLTSGVITTKALNLSAWTKLRSSGALGSSVLSAHPDTTGAHVTLLPDSDQSTSVAGKPVFDNVVMQGDKVGTNVHGIYLADEADDGDSSPTILNSLIVNYSGDCIHKGKHHNQLRMINSKASGADGYGLYIDKDSDSKCVMVGFGRSLQGQVYLNDCASPQFACYDVWNGGGFRGKYALEMISCLNTRWFQGEIAGPIRWAGDNYFGASGKTAYNNCGSMFVGLRNKFDVDTYMSFKSRGLSYDAHIDLEGSDGFHFAHVTWGYDPETMLDPDTGTAAPPPKYIWKFNAPGYGNYATDAGHVIATSCDMLTKNFQPGKSAAVTPFSKHWSNDPARVIFRTHKPGDIVLRAAAAADIAMLECNGAIYNKADYPLLYLGLDFSRVLTSGDTTFAVPNLPGPAAGYKYYVIAY